MNPLNKKFSELLFQINNPGVVLQDVYEQLIEQLEEDVFSLIRDIVDENYVLSEDTVEPTEDDLYILNLVIEHAIENRNDPDIEEIVEQLVLDESIGSAIATAVHGVSSFLAKRKLSSTQQKLQKASNKLKQSQNVTKSAGRAKGVFQKAKVGFEKARQPALKQKANQAQAKHAQQTTKAHDVQTKRTNLASKIDTGVTKAKDAVKSKVDQAKTAIKSKFQAAKDKVSSAVSKGAEKVGNIAGRVVNKIAG
jgi:hypothetical protein